MELPQGFTSQGEKQVCRLVKSLYGLKQAPRQWNAKLSKALVELKFKQSEYDQSMFIKKDESGMVIILVYVDDLLVTGDSLRIVKETKEKLKQVFKMKDLGELRYFLGIEFARSDQGILMHQRKYTLELISETGLSSSKPVATPMDTNVKLTTKQLDEYIRLKSSTQMIN